MPVKLSTTIGKISCHSELYWHGFHQGYDKQWNNYNYQSTTQGTSINIYGNNNYVSTSQNSGQSSQQGQNPSITTDPNPGFCSLGSCGGEGEGEGWNNP
jgi:hypothetical protein